jgi:hypothetical protein
MEHPLQSWCYCALDHHRHQLISWITIILGEAYPSTIIEWFVTFKRNKLLGLLYNNAFDVFSNALLGIMYLALYIAIRRYNQSLMVIAAFLSFLGIIVFVATRAVLCQYTSC